MKLFKEEELFIRTTRKRKNGQYTIINRNYPVKSVSSFLKMLKKIKNDNDHRIYYRGHSQVSFNKNIVPKLYRKEQYKDIYEREHELLINAQINYPEEFSHQNTTFEKMALMQHYKLPTRLLDLTENPLVALYFACNEKKNEENGSALVFKIHKRIIKYYSDESVSVLCAISKIENDIIKKIGKQFGNKVKKVMPEVYTAIQENYKKVTPIIIISAAIDIIRTSKDPDTQITLRKILNECSNMKYIFDEIKYEKPHFKEGSIDFIDFHNRILCVKSKLNDKRIRVQSGLFLLFGIKGFNKANCPDINHKKGLGNILLDKIIIDKNSKEEILKELRILGISEATLFPGLEHSSAESLLKH